MDRHLRSSIHSTTGPSGIPPSFTVQPAITGSTAAGSTLTSDGGTAVGDATIVKEYEWFDNGFLVEGADDATYDTDISQLGHAIHSITYLSNDTQLRVASSPSNVIVVSAIPIAVWTNADGDNLFVNPLNWDSGVVPDAFTWVEFNDDTSADNCITPASPDDPEVYGIRAGNFSGDISNESSLQDAIFYVHSDVTLNEDIQTSRKFQLHILGDCQLTTGGFLKMALVSTAAGKTLTLLDDVSARLIDLVHISVHFGTKKITFSNAAGANGTCNLYGSGTHTWSSGAKIVVTTSTTMVLVLGGVPPIEMSGGVGTVNVDTVTCESFTITAGTLVGTSARTLNVVGDFTGSGGTTIIDGTSALAVAVGGNFLITGIVMNNITANVTGTAVAHSTPITDCDFSGGTTLDANDGCTDGGGNDNIDFPLAPLTFDVSDPYTGITLTNLNLTAEIGGATEHVLHVAGPPQSSGVYAIVFTAANNFGNAIVGFHKSTISQIGDFLHHDNTKRGLGANNTRWLCIVNLNNTTAGTSPNIPAGNAIFYKDAILQVGPNPLGDWTTGDAYYAAISTLDHTVTAPVITMDVVGFTVDELAVMALYGAAPWPQSTLAYADFDTSITHGGTITFASPREFTAASPSHRIVPANMGKTTGRWYFEIIGIANTNNSDAGAWPDNATLLDYLGDSNSPFSLGWYQGAYYKGAGDVGMGGSHVDGDVMGFLIDLDARTMDFYLNGTHLVQTGLPGSAGPLWYPAACAVDQPVTMRAQFGPYLSYPAIPAANSAYAGFFEPA